MRRVFLHILFLSFLVTNFSCNTAYKDAQGNEIEDRDQPKIKFFEPNHDFGTIVEGAEVSHSYLFQNVGSMPLKITDIDVTCGCTVVEKPEYEIGVGRRASILVKFNSNGKVGVNNKNVTIHSNASNNAEVVSFKVEVTPKSN
ncbi:MAG: DUF1573 domain-containing protein [Leadbetterella sp.]